VGAEDLTLANSVHETLAASLDLIAQQKLLDASREEIGVARAGLLPQLDLGAKGQILDSDRPDDQRGNVSAKSVALAAGATQLLYDDDAWAAYTIQKHLNASTRSQYKTFRLSVVTEAATTFLELERAEVLEGIQRENRDITRENVDTARARVATGYSGERDVLRWQSQVSANDTAIVQAETRASVSRFRLNQIRNRHGEAPIRIVSAAIEEYGFVYALDFIADALADETRSTALRDFMVRVGLSRSPVLASIDAQMAAEERQVTAGSRAFWVPTFTVGAGVNYLAAEQAAGNSTTDTNQTEWGASATMTFPLFEGGGKIAQLRASRYTLSSLRTQRRADAQTIEMSIRSAFVQASGSYRSLGFAREQQKSSQRNFDLVNQSYIAGLASILDLLDAQTQLLTAQLQVADAHYSFLEDLMRAQQQISFFPFLHPPEEAAALLDQLQASLRAGARP
jgi:outer membrane protein TolC